MMIDGSASGATHPRPQLRRAGWWSLDGAWTFAFDDDARWSAPDEVVFDASIVVPFAPETPASGVGRTGFFRACWYRRELDAPPLRPGERCILRFAAADWATTAWLDGVPLGRHEGGYTPFAFDVTHVLARPGPHTLVVRCDDDPHDLAKPRGKQDWERSPHSIWYPRTTRIWQTVWLERVPECRIDALRWTANLERWEIALDLRVAAPFTEDVRLAVRLWANGAVLADDSYSVAAGEVHRRIALSDPGIDDSRNALLWSPEQPTLIDAELALVRAGERIDEVESYTALRTVAVDANRFLLNGRPYPLRLVLDQGYWPESGQTAPDDEALARDVRLAKAMGFNGVRKHARAPREPADRPQRVRRDRRRLARARVGLCARARRRCVRRSLRRSAARGARGRALRRLLLHAVHRHLPGGERAPVRGPHAEVRPGADGARHARAVARAGRGSARRGLRARRPVARPSPPMNERALARAARLARAGRGVRAFSCPPRVAGETHGTTEVGMNRGQCAGMRERNRPAVAPSDAPRGWDVVCLSHLRWDFVYQRPQHLMTRFARAGHRVHFVEEPVLGDALGLDVTDRQDGVQVVVPRVSPELPPWERDRVISALLDAHLARASGSERVLWYYTPMALGFARTLARRAVVYDCMDELSAFAGAPPELRERERELLALADVVFVGGASLYEARRRRHTNAHLFPSSVDVAHFSRARGPLEAPADQASIPRPRIGFFGVLDERLDAGLVADTAALRPDWHFVMIGPVVKIDPATLPRRPNVHWLGAKSYAELPGYAAGWDVAWLPFASNASTRFISPTKTPEYLAAGRPVVSTSVRDVVRLYGERGLARIADDPRATAAAIDAAMTEDPAARLRAADTLLAEMSWDRTFSEMHARVRAALRPPATRDAATGSEG